MKLLLKKDISTLGIVGDVVNVSPGYARNYLLPHNLATQPTAANMKALAEERAKAEERRRLRIEKLSQTAEKLADVEVTIEAAANEEGVLYGSVGPREVSAALREEGHEVSAEQVRMHETIKRLDNVVVDVVLADTIEATVKVWVVRSKASIGEDEESDDQSRSDQSRSDQAQDNQAQGDQAQGDQSKGREAYVDDDDD